MPWNYGLAAIILLVAAGLLLDDLDRASVVKKPTAGWVAQRLEADPNLKLVSESSPYMRTER